VNQELAARLAGYKKLIQGRLEEAITRSEPASLYDPMRYALAHPGKQLRPCLLLLSCEAVGGRTEQALDAALAIEVIHNFSLVHDDIMDHDELRRGRPTVHHRWDENVAILAGDALLVLGYALLARVESRHLPAILRTFSSAILEICEGQSLDKEFETRPEVSLAEYYSMIEKKTGRLFELACEAGAMLGGGGEETISALSSYGAQVGRAFQLQDDLLDLLGEEETIGKDVASDLEEDKKSFLIAHARHTASPAQQQALKKLTGRKPIEKEQLTAIIALFEEIGTLAAGREEIFRSLDKARSALRLLPQNPATAGLEAFIEAIAERTF